MLVHVAVQDPFAAAALALSCWTGTTLVLPGVSRGHSDRDMDGNTLVLPGGSAGTQISQRGTTGPFLPSLGWEQ